MTITQLEAAVARAAQAEAAIYEESLVRASKDEATTEQVTAAVSRIAASEAALVTEQTTRATNDTAIVAAVNTMWAMTGATQALVQNGSYVQTNWNAAHANWWNTLQAEVFGSGGETIRQALAQEAELRSNADGSLFAQYTVKIDQNGYVSGFGLASTANNGTPFSEFIVRADRFAIGSPGVADRVPFIVLTSADAAGNLPGVYMDTASIRRASIGEALIQDAAITRAKIGSAAVGTAQIDDAAITRAKIGDAEISTLKIQGNAVTVPVSASGTTSATTASADFAGQPVCVVASATIWAEQTNGSDGAPPIIGAANVTVKRNGVTIATGVVLCTARYEEPGASSYSVTLVDYPGVGSHYYSISMTSRYPGSPVNPQCGVLALGVKR